MKQKNSEKINHSGYDSLVSKAKMILELSPPSTRILYNAYKFIGFNIKTNSILYPIRYTDSLTVLENNPDSYIKVVRFRGLHCSMITLKFTQITYICFHCDSTYRHLLSEKRVLMRLLDIHNTIIVHSSPFDIESKPTKFLVPSFNPTITYNDIFWDGTRIPEYEYVLNDEFYQQEE